MDDFKGRLLSLEETRNGVLLIDLSSISQTATENRANIVDILAFANVSKNFVVVVSHTSGGGCLLERSTPFGRKVANLHGVDYEEKELLPFTEAEASIFWECCSRGKIINVSDLKRLTNYNPYLLRKCIGKADMRQARKAVKSEVKVMCDHVIASLLNNDSLWYTRNTETCVYMLHIAAHHEKASTEDYYDDYNGSWLSMEGITYIAEENDEFFYPRLNFPGIDDILMSHLHKMAQTSTDVTYNEVMKGYLFEDKFLSPALRELFVTYIPGGSDKAATAVLDVNSCITTNKKEINSLVVGCVVHFTKTHPVIDGVARLKDRQGQEWLLFIQVSLSPYHKHKSNATHLRTKEKPFVTRCKGLCAGDVKCMYLYISPSTVSTSDLLNMNVKKSMLPADMYLGIATEDSPTHKFIKEKIAEL